MSRQAHTSTFPAMSTTVSVISVGLLDRDHQRALDEIRAEVEVWQDIFSRFRPNSMLSSVNGRTGNWAQVNDIFLDLLENAADAVVATEGRFNPAILGALEAQGYDRSIDEIRTLAPSTFASPEIVSGVDVWMLVEIDRVGMRVRLPRNLRIDLGGIAKGALADRLAQRFGHWPGGAISIGGDMCIWGDAPDGDSWRVGIEHPLNPEHDVVTLELPTEDRCAIATSSRTKRAWSTGAGRAHHLIDPFTGASVDSYVLAVSVCAPTAVTAEVVSKNLVVAAAHGPLTSDLLLDAHWAITISNTLDLNRIAKQEAA